MDILPLDGAFYNLASSEACGSISEDVAMFANIEGRAILLRVWTASARPRKCPQCCGEHCNNV
eukprot:scaffold416733_cov31-Prasinocladus_malaysianus.AAC.1